MDSQRGGGKPDAPKSGGPLDFHSSRQERLARFGAPHQRAGGTAGVFRGNRTLLVVLLDILLFLMLGVLLVRFLYAQTPRARLQGYEVSLRGLSHGEMVYATLTVRAEAAAEKPGDGRIYVRLSVSRDPADGQATFVSGQLPGPGNELVLREGLPASGAKSATLYAQVRVGKTVRLLSCGW